MPGTQPLAKPSDVADIWRPLTDGEEQRISNLITKASAKLRQACPFDIDARIELFETTPTAPTALNPVIVADRVAIIVKRFLVNPDGYSTLSESEGDYSISGAYVNRYDKTGSDVRGELRVTDEDIDELRPAVPAPTPSVIAVGVPLPRVLVPQPSRRHPPFGRTLQRGGAAIIPDFAPDTGVE